MIPKDTQLKKLLAEKGSPGLNEAFEERMMKRILHTASAKSYRRRYERFMYLFFIIGLISGILLIASFTERVLSFGDLILSTNQLFLLLPFVAIILFLFEKVYRALLYQRGYLKIVDM